MSKKHHCCFIYLFFLSANIYWVPTTCEALGWVPHATWSWPCQGDKSTSHIMASDRTGLITGYRVSTEERLPSWTFGMKEKTDLSGLVHLAVVEWYSGGTGRTIWWLARFQGKGLLSFEPVPLGFEEGLQTPRGSRVVGRETKVCHNSLDLARDMVTRFGQACRPLGTSDAMTP